MILRSQSIRWRLQVWYALLMAAALSAAGWAAHGLEEGRVWAEVDEDLRRSLNLVVRAFREERIRRAPDDDRLAATEPRPLPAHALDPPAMSDLMAAVGRGMYYVVWAGGGREWFRSGGGPGPAVPVAEVEFGQSPVRRTRGSWREVAVRARQDATVLMGRSVQAEQARLRRLAGQLALIGLAVQLTGMAGGWWVATAALRPLRTITDTARRIAKGDTSQRIPVVEAESELGALGEVLNDSFSKVEGMIDRQRQFTADAAHELRTPVSVIHAQCQAALARERSANEYRAALEACGRASGRMRRLIEALLELARLDADEFEMEAHVVDWAEVVREAAALLEPRAGERGVRFELNLDPVAVRGDPILLGQVAANLLSNAIDHSPNGGAVRVRLTAEGMDGVLGVEDEGPGIRPDDLPRLFDRFYRASKSRNDGGEHAGLGLAIVRAIAARHGGRVGADNLPGRGARFQVTVPLAMACEAGKPGGSGSKEAGDAS